jgi:Transcriptional regulator/sugar kinase
MIQRHTTASAATDAPDRGLLAGIDIGGTTTQVVLCDDTLKVVASGERATPARAGGEAMAEAAVDLVTRLARDSGRRVGAIGVGAAGLVDTATGRIVGASDSFVGWAGFPLGEVLSAALGVPAFVENDVNAFLLGEVRAGTATGARSALGITLGTGVGGALWLDGRLWSGPRGAAGEIGHIPGFGDEPCTCGGRGHLETVASGRGIERHYLVTSGRRAGAREIAERAATGEREAIATMRRAAHGAARGILITVGLLDVATVVVGGGVSRAWPVLGPLIHAALEGDPPVSRTAIVVEPSALGGDAVALGAAALAQNALAPRTTRA